MMTRAAFARRLGIHPLRLSSYEHARVPLRYGVVDLIGRVFDLNQVWLAEGKFEMTPYFPPREKVRARLKDNDLFSAAYFIHIRPDILEFEKSAMFYSMAMVQDEPPLFSKGVNTKPYLDFVLESLKAEFAECPQRQRGAFLQHVIQSLSSFWAKRQSGVGAAEFSSAPAESEHIGESFSNSLLTDTQHSESIENVRSITQLMAALRRHTNSPGKKTELAGALNLPLSTISRYLSGKMEPGGEATLKLLKWVEEQERSSK